MGRTDVVIIGGGLAGSIAAAMLGRAGIDAVLIDPHTTYPADFRCEKLDPFQTELLRKTGLADIVLRRATRDEEVWVARLGRLVDRRPGHQHGILYDTLVNTVRGAIPGTIPLIAAKVMDVATGPDRQLVTLSTGETITARLAVLANGLNVSLRQKLGLTRTILSAGHSISAGFDVRPAGGGSFPFRALTYFTAHPSDRMSYLSLFPIGTSLRANLFGYRDLNDPWFQDFRRAPQETLYALWPRLGRLMGDFTVDGMIKVRPVDLYETRGHRQPGLVLVGDAFSTSCPAAGTGARKVLNDVERLCNVHIPDWLSTPRMGVEKINAYYDDPVKLSLDAWSMAKAFSLRTESLGTGPGPFARRTAKFAIQWTRGLPRRLSASLPPTPRPPVAPLPQPK